MVLGLRILSNNFDAILNVIALCLIPSNEQDASDGRGHFATNNDLPQERTEALAFSFWGTPLFKASRTAKFQAREFKPRKSTLNP